MKVFVLLWLCFVSPLVSGAEVEVKRCINILGDDQSWFTKNGFFKGRHLDAIKIAGFDTVRLNLKAFRHMDKQGHMDPEWMNALHSLVSAALDRNLIVILDQHDFRACGKSYQECKEKLPKFWKSIAREFSSAPPQVLFEIHNEPNGEFNFIRWNLMIPKILNIIRRSNPHRDVIIGPGGWNAFSNMKRLQIPVDDRLIFTVHYYSPLEFTHQGVPGYNPGKSATLRTQRWGNVTQRLDMDTYLDSVKRWQASNNRQIFIGEFGVFGDAPITDRKEWNRDLIVGAERRGLGWCAYQFEGHFGIYSRSEDNWLPDNGVIETLQDMRKSD